MSDDETRRDPEPAEEGPARAPGPEDAGGTSARTDRRIKAAADALRSLLRDFYESRFGANPPRGEAIEVDLRVVARPAEGWALSFEPPLADQLGAQFEDAQAGWGVYAPGRVFCYRCNDSACEHAAPDSPLAVFTGYDSAGRPEWRELAQALVEARRDGVESLFDRPPQVIAHAQLGHDLRGRQLQAFGRASKTYAVLGQVVAGYFALPGASEDGGRVAVTLQIVESRSKDGDLELHLNTVAAPANGSRVGDLLAGGWAPALERARAIADRDVRSLEFRARAARQRGQREEARQAMREIPKLLFRLASFIERGDRQGQRRTRHAEARRHDRRPVHKAIEDARRAGDGAWFYDVKARTIVVCGERGRAHAFSEAGRHVTSFLIKPNAVEMRLRTQRWRPLTADERVEHRARLAQPRVSGREEEHAGGPQEG